MKNAEQIALVKAALEQLDDNALISAWNEYANGDDWIYNNDEYFFEENFSTHYQAVSAVAFGDYRYGDTYVKFNGLANLDSFDSVSDNVNFDTLADYAWEKRLDCIDWDEIEEGVGEEFRAHCEKNGLPEEKYDQFMSEEFDWENDFSEMIERLANMNNHRRKQTQAILTLLESARLDLEQVKDDEEEANESTPEQLRKENADEIISELELAACNLNEVILSIEELLE